MIHRPPQWMLRFLRAVCRDDLLEAVEGDLIDQFNRQLKHKGKPLAQLLFLFNALQFVQPVFMRKTKNFTLSGVSANHLKSILRNLYFHKGFTAINLLGMSLAFAFTLAIYTFVSHELSYDRYQANHENIFRLTMRVQNDNGYDIHWARTDLPWVNEIPANFPEVQSIVRLQSFRPRRVVVKEEKFLEENAFSADAEVIESLDLQLIKGTQEALNGPYSVVLTATTARKYFGDANPMGQTIALLDANSQQLVDHKVTGVIEDQPSNTHLPITLLSSINRPEDRTGWAYVYLVLNKNGADAVQAKLPQFVSERNQIDGLNITLGLQPISDIHLHSQLSREVKANGNGTTVRLFIIVAFFLIAISSVNFANLSSVKSFSRTKEIGVRKALGVRKSQLYFFFMIESIVVVGFSALLGLALFYAFKAPIEEIIGFSLHLNWAEFALGSLVLVILISLLASIYPASMALRFSLISSKKAGEKGASSPLGFRNALMGLQFLIALTLLSGTFLLQRQFSFITHRNLGYDQEQLMAINNLPVEAKASYYTYKSVLKGISGVDDVSAMLELPSRPIKDEGAVRITGRPDGEAYTADLQVIDVNGFELLGVELKAGSVFPKSISSQTRLPGEGEDFQAFLNANRRSYLINESAMRAFGWTKPEEAINQMITWNIGNLSLGEAPIAGVVADFHQESIHAAIDPVVFTYEPFWFNNILIKTDTDNYPKLISKIEASWDEFYPDLPLELVFADQEVAQLYKAEEAQRTLMMVFSFSAILITLLGLYSMIAYTLERRLKEMAIRKVLGAELKNLLVLLSKPYMIISTVSLLLCLPLVIYFGQQWLSSFAYRINMNGSSILISFAFLALIIACSLVYQILKLKKSGGST